MSTEQQAGITVYQRPGCPYCMMLRRGLHRAGVSHEEIDIWDEPDAAAFVRSVADGNETVPTVTVGPVSVVNPSARDVIDLARVHAPDSVPPEVGPHRKRRWRDRVGRRPAIDSPD